LFRAGPLQPDDRCERLGLRQVTYRNGRTRRAELVNSVSTGRNGNASGADGLRGIDVSWRVTDHDDATLAHSCTEIRRPPLYAKQKKLSTILGVRTKTTERESMKEISSDKFDLCAALDVSSSETQSDVAVLSKLIKQLEHARHDPITLRASNLLPQVLEVATEHPFHVLERLVPARGPQTDPRDGPIGHAPELDARQGIRTPTHVHESTIERTPPSATRKDERAVQVE